MHCARSPLYPIRHDMLCYQVYLCDQGNRSIQRWALQSTHYLDVPVCLSVSVDETLSVLILISKGTHGFLLTKVYVIDLPTLVHSSAISMLLKHKSADLGTPGTAGTAG